MQYPMIRQPKAMLGAPPQYLPPIDIRAANGPPRVHYRSNTHQDYYSPPQSRSSSFSSNSWQSAQDDSSYVTTSSYHSPNASFYSSSPPTSSAWLDYHSPHRSPLHPTKSSFLPPTAALEELLERLSHYDVSPSDLAFIRETLYRGHSVAAAEPRFLPNTPTTSINTATPEKGEFC